MCDFPLTVKNQQYGKYHRPSVNIGNMIQVPCGSCVICLQNRSNSWYLRLHHELKSAITAHFVTLTYNNESLKRTENGLLTVNKSDVQNYFKRLRKRENNKDIKYYLGSEYGEKEQRPHYHAIIFNVAIKANIARAWRLNDYPLGNVHIGEVTEASIKYVTGYIGKKIGIPHTDYDDRTKEFSLMSKKIGLENFMKNSSFNLNNEVGYTQINGIKYNLPRYYKEKLFTQNQKQNVSAKNYDNHVKNLDKKINSFNSYKDYIYNELSIKETRNKSHVKRARTSILNTKN